VYHNSFYLSADICCRQSSLFWGIYHYVFCGCLYNCW